MNQIESLLRKFWWSIDLPGYRNHPKEFATYSAFDYAALPPIEEPLDARFDWLRQERPHADLLEIAVDGSQVPDFSEKLASFLAVADLKLPEAFTTFMQSPDLHRSIRSATACYLELPDYLVWTIGPEHGFLLHFLSDQQWCLHWYLYVNVTGEHGVIVSPNPYGFRLGESDDEEGLSSNSSREIDLTQEEVWWCASSFAVFLYRFWLENEIWFSLAYDKQPLTARQRAYAEHYKQT